MTTLAERAKIERDSISDPASPPTGATQQEVEAAVLLLARVRSGVVDVAQSRLATPPPDPETIAWRESIAWARDALGSPDSWGRIVLRLLMAKFDALTPAQLVAVTDEQITTEIAALAPTLALGRDVRRT